MEESKEINQDDYKYGLIYDQKKDPRLFVPKGSGGIGWTVNFSNKWSYVIIAALIGFVIFSIVYGLFFQQ